MPVGIFKIFSDKRAIAEKFANRYAICESCPHFNNETLSCGTLFSGGTVEIDGKTMFLCGCYMPAKTKFVNKKCPIGKW